MEGHEPRKRTRVYAWVMTMLYIGVVVMAFVPGFHPLCGSKKSYPYVMSWASLLFIINYIFHWVVYCNISYFLKPVAESEESIKAKYSQSSVNVSDSKDIS